jgi:hypothetical protein
MSMCSHELLFDCAKQTVGALCALNPLSPITRGRRCYVSVCDCTAKETRALTCCRPRSDLDRSQSPPAKRLKASSDDEAYAQEPVGSGASPAEAEAPDAAEGMDVDDDPTGGPGGSAAGEKVRPWLLPPRATALCVAPHVRCGRLKGVALAVQASAAGAGDDDGAVGEGDEADKENDAPMEAEEEMVMKEEPQEVENLDVEVDCNGHRGTLNRRTLMVVRARPPSVL